MSPHRPRYVATAEFSCDLSGIAFDACDLPPSTHVERLKIAADGRRLTVTVTTQPVRTHVLAEQIAREAADDVWWGLQRELGPNVGSASRLLRDSIGFSQEDADGNMSVSVLETIHPTDSVSAILRVGAQTLQAAARHRRPAASHAADLYRDAVAEHDPVLQFQGLYNAMVAAVQAVMKCDCQTCTDEFILQCDSAAKLVPCLPREKRARARHARDPRLADHATEYTSLRNRLDHAHSRDRAAQGGWAATAREIQGAVGRFRVLVLSALWAAP